MNVSICSENLKTLLEKIPIKITVLAQYFCSVFIFLFI